MITFLLRVMTMDVFDMFATLCCVLRYDSFLVITWYDYVLDIKILSNLFISVSGTCKLC